MAEEGGALGPAASTITRCWINPNSNWNDGALRSHKHNHVSYTANADMND